MRFLIIKSAITYFIIAGISLFNNSYAQESPSHWSIDVFGGTGVTHFNVGSEPRPSYGLSLKYSITPITSVSGTYYRGQFYGAGDNYFGRSFETDFNHFSLRTHVNMLRLLGADVGFLRNSALDGIFGIGLLDFDVSVDIDEIEAGWQHNQGQAVSSNTHVLIAGASVRQYLSRRIDFIAQFEYNFSGSDLLDGYESLPGSFVDGNRVRNDSYTMFTAGLSFKFGSSRRDHVSWERQPQITALEHRQQIDELLDLFEGRLVETNQEITQIKEQINQLDELVSDTYARQFEAHNQKLMELEAEMEDLRESTRLGMLDYSEPSLPQYFVIADTFTNETMANNRLEELLQEGYRQARIVVDYNGSHFNVSYSQHGTYRAANERLRDIRRNHNPNAWIYTIR